MTLHAIVGTVDLIAAATDTSVVARDLATGAARDAAAMVRPKAHALSSRYPRAVATFGLSTYSPERSVAAATARLRARLDAEADPTCSVEALTQRVVDEMLATFRVPFLDIERRGWLDSTDAPAGCLATGAFVGGYTIGFDGHGGPAECWFWLVNGRGVVRVERKARGEPGRWWCVVSPGALAAGAAIREVIRETPRTVEHAAAMARELVDIEIVKPSPGMMARGPVSMLALTRGVPPQEIGVTVLDSPSAQVVPIPGRNS